MSWSTQVYDHTYFPQSVANLNVFCTALLERCDFVSTDTLPLNPYQTVPSRLKWTDGGPPVSAGSIIQQVNSDPTDPAAVVAYDDFSHLMFEFAHLTPGYLDPAVTIGSAGWMATYTPPTVRSGTDGSNGKTLRQRAGVAANNVYPLGTFSPWRFKQPRAIQDFTATTDYQGNTCAAGMRAYADMAVWDGSANSYGVPCRCTAIGTWIADATAPVDVLDSAAAAPNTCSAIGNGVLVPGDYYLQPTYFWQDLRAIINVCVTGFRGGAYFDTTVTISSAYYSTTAASWTAAKAAVDAHALVLGGDPGNTFGYAKISAGSTDGTTTWFASAKINSVNLSYNTYHSFSATTEVWELEDSAGQNNPPTAPFTFAANSSPIVTANAWNKYSTQTETGIMTVNLLVGDANPVLGSRPVWCPSPSAGVTEGEGFVTDGPSTPPLIVVLKGDVAGGFTYRPSTP